VVLKYLPSPAKGSEPYPRPTLTMAEQHLQMKYKLWIFHAINNTKHGVLKVQLWTFLVVESGRTKLNLATLQLTSVRSRTRAKERKIS
jgi:hypothetical protein